MQYARVEALAYCIQHTPQHYTFYRYQARYNILSGMLVPLLNIITDAGRTMHCEQAFSISLFRGSFWIHNVGLCSCEDPWHYCCQQYKRGGRCR